MKKINQLFGLFLFAIFLVTSVNFAQEKPAEKCKDACKKECCVKKAANEEHVCADACKNGCTAANDKKDAAAPKCSPTKKDADMHAGHFDVSAADVNKDGFVYQCPMHCTTQTTDAPGSCEKCGMDLKKYSVDEAEKYLEKK